MAEVKKLPKFVEQYDDEIAQYISLETLKGFSKLSKNKTDLAMRLFQAGIPPNIVGKIIGIPENMAKAWFGRFREIFGEAIDEVLHFGEKKEKEQKKGEDKLKVDEFTPETILDRVQALMRSPLTKHELAAELARKELEIRELKNMLKMKNPYMPIGFGGDGFDTELAAEMATVLKEMRKLLMQKVFMKEMIRIFSEGEDINNKLMKYLERLEERLNKLEKKDEIERAIAPLREKLEKLGEKEDISPEVKKEIDELKKVLDKLTEERKWSEIKEMVEKLASKSSDPIQFLREADKLRQEYESRIREKELELMKEREDRYREQLYGAIRNLEEKLEKLKKEGTDMSKLNDLVNTVKTIKEIAGELGGATKRSTLDKLFDVAAPKVLEGMTEIAKMKAQMQSPMYQQQIMQQPQPQQQMIQQPQAQQQVVQQPQVGGNTPGNTNPNPSSGQKQDPLIQISHTPSNVKVVRDKYGNEKYYVRGKRGALSREELMQYVGEGS